MRKSAGFTLIEVLITSSLSLLLILSLLAYILSIKRDIQLQQAYAELQQNALLSLALLRQEFTARDEPAIWFNQNGTNEGGGAARPDRFSMQHQTNIDCTGAQSTQPIRNRYTLHQTSLNCNGEPLLAPIDMMQLLYGIANERGQIERYLTAAQVVQLNLQAQVQAVRVALLWVSSQDVLAEARTQRFQLLNELPLQRHDKKLRQLITMTLPLGGKPHATP